MAKDSGIEYSAEQTQAIREAATSGLLLITGGPGTGKTTLLTGILSLLGNLQMKCLVAAPTGRAAKRMAEVTGEEASTIHRLLEAGTARVQLPAARELDLRAGAPARRA